MVTGHPTGTSWPVGIEGNVILGRWYFRVVKGRGSHWGRYSVRKCGQYVYACRWSLRWFAPSCVSSLSEHVLGQIKSNRGGHVNSIAVFGPSFCACVPFLSLLTPSYSFGRAHAAPQNLVHGFIPLPKRVRSWCCAYTQRHQTPNGLTIEIQSSRPAGAKTSEVVRPPSCSSSTRQKCVAWAPLQNNKFGWEKLSFFSWSVPGVLRPHTVTVHQQRRHIHIRHRSPALTTQSTPLLSTL